MRNIRMGVDVCEYRWIWPPSECPGVSLTPVSVRLCLCGVQREYNQKRQPICYQIDREPNNQTKSTRQFF